MHTRTLLNVVKLHLNAIIVLKLSLVLSHEHTHPRLALFSWAICMLRLIAELPKNMLCEGSRSFWWDQSECRHNRTLSHYASRYRHLFESLFLLWFEIPPRCTASHALLPFSLCVYALHTAFSAPTFTFSLRASRRRRWCWLFFFSSVFSQSGMYSFFPSNHI